MHHLLSAKGDDPVVLEGLFRASLSRVWRAWTEPDELTKWFGKPGGGCVSAEVDLRVGGRWRCVISEAADGRSALEGEYRVVETERRLIYSWRHVVERPDGAREATADSQVTVEFAAEGAAARVRLRHEGILRREGREGVAGGWGAAFARLGERVETAPRETA